MSTIVLGENAISVCMTALPMCVIAPRRVQEQSLYVSIREEISI